MTYIVSVLFRATGKVICLACGLLHDGVKLGLVAILQSAR